jgi:hypothetical protein
LCSMVRRGSGVRVPASASLQSRSGKRFLDGCGLPQQSWGQKSAFPGGTKTPPSPRTRLAHASTSRDTRFAGNRLAGKQECVEIRYTTCTAADRPERCIGRGSQRPMHPVPMSGTGEPYQPSTMRRCTPSASRTQSQPYSWRAVVSLRSPGSAIPVAPWPPSYAQPGRSAEPAKNSSMLARIDARSGVSWTTRSPMRGLNRSPREVDS